jgi:hypothetical protein
MSELCEGLSLSIYKEDDPAEKGQERVRIVLRDELEMSEVSECYPINVTTHQNRRYHIMEAVVIGLRRVVSEAFRRDLISDSLGTWMISKSPTKEPSSTKSETDLGL